MYKRILLAYDGSREGAIALREGALIAKTCGAQVFLLSVVPETGGVLMVEGAQGGMLPKMAEAYKEQLQRGLDNAVSGQDFRSIRLDHARLQFIETR